MRDELFAEASEPSAAQGSGQTLGYSPLSRHHIAKRDIPFHISFFALSLLTILSPSLVFFPPLTSARPLASHVTYNTLFEQGTSGSRGVIRVTGRWIWMCGGKERVEIGGC